MREDMWKFRTNVQDLKGDVSSMTDVELGRAVDGMVPYTLSAIEFYTGQIDFSQEHPAFRL
jgi:hypothetical protein